MEDSKILDTGPDLFRQNWYSDEWYYQACGGSLKTPDQVWSYFRQSIFIDHESDNWNLHVQFSEDPEYGFGRMGVDLQRLSGKQYHIVSSSPMPASSLASNAASSSSSSLPPLLPLQLQQLSHPSSLVPATSGPPPAMWLIHKYLKSASATGGLSSKSNRGMGIVTGTGTDGLAILETFVVLGKWIYKACSVSELMMSRMTSATTSITQSLSLFRAQASRYQSNTTSGSASDQIWLSEPMGGNAATDEVEGEGAELRNSAQAEGEGMEGADRDDRPTGGVSNGGKPKRKENGDRNAAKGQALEDVAIWNAIWGTKMGLVAGLLEERERERTGSGAGVLGDEADENGRDRKRLRVG